MPCNASYARFIFGKFFTSTVILYVLLFAQKVLFLQKVGVTVVEVIKSLKISSEAIWNVRTQRLWAEIESIRFKEGESVDDFTMCLGSLVTTLGTLGEEIKEH
jgi:hypothetical protein